MDWISNGFGQNVRYFGQNERTIGKLNAIEKPNRGISNAFGIPAPTVFFSSKIICEAGSCGPVV